MKIFLYFFILNQPFSINETSGSYPGYLTLFSSPGEVCPTHSTGLFVTALWLKPQALLLLFFSVLVFNCLFEIRSAWKVMAREFQLMVSLYHSRLVRLILVNQEQMGSTVFINLYTRWFTDEKWYLYMHFGTYLRCVTNLFFQLPTFSTELPTGCSAQISTFFLSCQLFKLKLPTYSTGFPTGCMQNVLYCYAVTGW